MAKRFGKAKIFEYLALAGAVFLAGITVAQAIQYPVDGIPLYGKSLLGAIFLGLVYFSIRRERKRKPVQHLGEDDITRKKVERHER